MTGGDNASSDAASTVAQRGLDDAWRLQADLGVFVAVAAVIVGQGILFVLGFDQLRPPSPDVADAERMGLLSLVFGGLLSAALIYRVTRPFPRRALAAVLPLAGILGGSWMGWAFSSDIEVQTGRCSWLCLPWFDFSYLLPLTGILVGALVVLSGFALRDGNTLDELDAAWRRALITLGVTGLVLAIGIVPALQVDTAPPFYAYLGTIMVALCVTAGALVARGRRSSATAWRSVAAFIVGYHAAMALRLGLEASAIAP